MPKWKETAQYAKVDFRIVEMANPRTMDLRREWPEDLRWLIDAFSKTKEARTEAYSAPRFFIGQDETLVVTARGFSGWRDIIVPTLTRMVGA